MEPLLQVGPIPRIVIVYLTAYPGRDHTQISPTGRIAAEVTVAVFSSTLHAQDFKDASGDRLTGRRTFPILFPVASRVAIGLAIPLWSIFLSFMWKLDWLCATAFIAYGSVVGARFMLYRTVAADKLSCKYYSVSSIGICNLGKLAQSPH